MAEKHRVGFIGCGKRAHQAAAGTVADGRADVVALADISSDSASALSDKFGFGGAAIFTDHKQMLAEAKPDVVIGSLWTPLHLPIFRDCAEAGVKAFLSEKPMAPSWGESLEMAYIAEKSGCLLTFCHQRRFAVGNLKLRELLDAGLFGEIICMDLYSPCGLLDCGTHSIDQALSFNRESPAKWVMGAVDTSEIKVSFGVPTEKMSIGLIVFENGVRANIQCLGPDRDMPTGIRVHGTKGMVEVHWDGQIGRCIVYDNPGFTFPTPADPEEGYVMKAVIGNALDALETGNEPELSYKKALRATEIIYALYESATNRRMVELPLDVKANNFTATFGPKE